MKKESCREKSIFPPESPLTTYPRPQRSGRDGYRKIQQLSRQTAEKSTPFNAWSIPSAFWGAMFISAAALCWPLTLTRQQKAFETQRWQEPMRTATIQKARAVRLCTEVFSLLDALHGPWVTPSSYSRPFIFRCCWPLLNTLEEGSSDCCPCVNLSVPPHTHPFPSCPVMHYSYIFTNHLFKAKYLNQFFVKIQRMQKKAV